MAAFGYVLIVAIAALWARQEYGPSRQIRTTLLATPNRLAVVMVKAAILAAWVAIVTFLTMWGTIVITHAVDPSGADPWALNVDIWLALGGVVLAWIVTALTTFAIGSIARSAVVPLALLVPLVMGVGDLLVDLWPGRCSFPWPPPRPSIRIPPPGPPSRRCRAASSLRPGPPALLAAASLVAVRRTRERAVILSLRAHLSRAFSLTSVRLVLAAALVAPPALALASGLTFDPGAPASASFPIEAHGFETAGLGQPS